MGLRGLPLSSLGLRGIEEYSDSYLAVRDPRKAWETLGGKGHSRGTVAREAPSDGRSKGYNGLGIRGATRTHSRTV